MKLNSFDIANLHGEPYYGPAPSVPQSSKRVANLLNSSNRLRASRNMPELTYTNETSPSQTSMRFVSLMSYDKSKLFPHIEVKIEPWIEASHV